MFEKVGEEFVIRCSPLQNLDNLLLVNQILFLRCLGKSYIKG
jgi:hypothetical protein